MTTCEDGEPSSGTRYTSLISDHEMVLCPQELDSMSLASKGCKYEQPHSLSLSVSGSLRKLMFSVPTVLSSVCHGSQMGNTFTTLQSKSSIQLQPTSASWSSRCLVPKDQQTRRGAEVIDPDPRAGKGRTALTQGGWRGDQFWYVSDPSGCLLVFPCPFLTVSRRVQQS